MPHSGKFYLYIYLSLLEILYRRWMNFCAVYYFYELSEDFFDENKVSLFQSYVETFLTTTANVFGNEFLTPKFHYLIYVSSFISLLGPPNLRLKNFLRAVGASKTYQVCWWTDCKHNSTAFFRY